MNTAPTFRPSQSKYLVFTSAYLLPLLICLSVAFIVYLTLYSSFFKINHVMCTLDYEECSDPVLLAEIDHLKGQNIFTLSPQAVSTRLIAGDFRIREAKIQRELPGTVRILLQSVYPVVALQIKNDPTWVLMDNQFRVISTRTIDPNVPTIIVPGPLTLTIGKPPTNPLIIRSLSLAKKLADEFFTFKTLTMVDEDTIELVLPSGKTAIFTPKKDELEQLKLLQVILGGVTITKEMRVIDVRFSQPVLR